MSYGYAQLVHAVFDAIRNAMWMIVSGFAVIGATFYGGAGLYAYWQKAGTPASRREDTSAGDTRASDKRAVAREAAEGIAEIEAFLATEVLKTRPTEAPQAERKRRNVPPAQDEAA